MTKVQARPGFVRLYDATKGLETLYIRHLCAKCLRKWRAAGWNVRAGMWTAEDSDRAKCYGCATGRALP